MNFITAVDCDPNFGAGFILLHRRDLQRRIYYRRRKLVEPCSSTTRELFSSLADNAS